MDKERKTGEGKAVSKEILGISFVRDPKAGLTTNPEILGLSGGLGYENGPSIEEIFEKIEKKIISGEL